MMTNWMHGNVGSPMDLPQLKNLGCPTSYFHCLAARLNVMLLQDIFSGEILGAVALAGDLKPTMQVKPVKIFAEGVESKDGQTVTDKKYGKLVKILENVDPTAYYDLFANRLGNMKQSAVIGSFDEQKRQWSTQPK